MNSKGQMNEERGRRQVMEWEHIEKGGLKYERHQCVEEGWGVR